MCIATDDWCADRSTRSVAPGWPHQYPWPHQWRHHHGGHGRARNGPRAPWGVWGRGDSSGRGHWTQVTPARNTHGLAAVFHRQENNIEKDAYYILLLTWQAHTNTTIQTKQQQQIAQNHKESHLVAWMAIISDLQPDGLVKIEKNGTLNLEFSNWHFLNQNYFLKRVKMILDRVLDFLGRFQVHF